MKKISVIIFLVVAALSASAQKAAVAKKNAKEKQSPVVLENTLLWEISGNHLTNPSYLFGTMHLLCAADAQLSDSLRYAISNAKQIYFEIDLDNMMETLGAMRYLNMNNNTKLSDLLTEEEYARVTAYFKKNKTMLPMSMMERLKPYFITSLISESKFPCAEKDGMEQVIMKEAKSQGKKIQGLETVAFQASIFDSIPYELQARELVKMIEGGDSTDTQSGDLLEAYRNQDLQKMQEFTLKEDGLISSNLDLLLFNRNARWAKQIDSLVQTKTLLFAVGAAHLPGDKGVIRLLQKQGYMLRPMKN